MESLINPGEAPLTLLLLNPDEKLLYQLTTSLFANELLLACPALYTELLFCYSNY